MAERNKPRPSTIDVVAKFLNQSSLEITPRQIDKIPLLEEIIPKKTPVFIALIDPAESKAQEAAALSLSTAGYKPVPHIPARFVRDEQDLRQRLKVFSETAGVTQALVIGGGSAVPMGKYESTMQLFETGAFQDYGFKRIGIAGHPESNPDIVKVHGVGMLIQSLQEKQAWIKNHGFEGFIATQFLFEAEPVIAWAEELRRLGIDLPISVGIPGPATIKTLVKYATMCGVGNSARFIRKQAMNLTKLLTLNTPDQFIEDLAIASSNRPDLAIAAPHFYPFGGFDKLFKWMEPKLKVNQSRL